MPPLVRLDYPQLEFAAKELRICGSCELAFEALPAARTKYCSRSCYWESKRQPEDDLGYMAAHDRVRVLWGRASEHCCVGCEKPARDWAYDGTDPSERYGTNSVGTYLHYSVWPEFYMPMCRGCHLKRDAALRHQRNQSKNKG